MMGAFPPPSYPRPPRLGELLRKKRDARPLHEKLVQELLALQRSSGLSATSDGRLLWDNVVEGSMSLLEGWEKADLVRFFDNNYFFRRPVYSSLKPSLRLGEELRLNPYSNRLLTVIGPASLSYLARGKLTVDWDYARAMAASLRPMDRGYLVVQEPALLEGPTSDLLSELSDALRSMRPPGVKTIMMVYFKPFSLAYEMLLDVAVDGLWLDCVSDPGWLTAIKEKGGRNITVLGLMDSRNTLLEKPSSLAGSLVSGSQTVAGDVFLAPNWGFDILPYPVAKQKTRLLGQALKEAS